MLAGGSLLRPPQSTNSANVTRWKDKFRLLYVRSLRSACKRNNGYITASFAATRSSNSSSSTQAIVTDRCNCLPCCHEPCPKFTVNRPSERADNRNTTTPSAGNKHWPLRLLALPVPCFFCTTALLPVIAHETYEHKYSKLGQKLRKAQLCCCREQNAHDGDQIKNTHLRKYFQKHRIECLVNKNHVDTHTRTRTKLL